MNINKKIIYKFNAIILYDCAKRKQFTLVSYHLEKISSVLKREKKFEFLNYIL